MWNVSGLEAVYRDYGPKGVKFFFIYKSLAHPELTGDYVQPFTLKERLAHARQAQKQLGATIPWIVDAMDNRLKHALGDRPNAEFIIDPKGKIVCKRAWSNPLAVRKDLEELVGKVAKITKEEDIKLAIQLPLKGTAERGVIPRIQRPRMLAIEFDPVIKPKTPLFYAKLRAEADSNLLRTGKGKLYLGFHIDPFHEAHWNNLTPPLKYTMELPKGVKITKASGEAPKVKATSDCDPREFLLDVESWAEDKPIKLTVRYSACVADACHAIQQDYILRLRRDRDGGGARGVGAGYWDEDFARQMISRSKRRDGKVDRTEVMGLLLPHFDKIDSNKDGYLDFEELKIVADWLNKRHQPGVPAPKPSK